MVPIGGRPMLDIWLDALDRAGVTEVLVNLHHLQHVVSDHLATRAASPKVRTVSEPELLGSAGTLVANRHWIGDDEFFLACNADNLTDFDLRALIDAHQEGEAEATLCVFHSPNPSAGGVVETDAAGVIRGFQEKPAHPVCDLVNAGVYAFNTSLLNEIKGDPPQDIGYDLLPLLVDRARTVLIDGYFRDIGTPEAYYKAQEEWIPR
jgi:mannose-1-phosphate guanylyltransferase